MMRLATLVMAIIGSPSSDRVEVLGKSAQVVRNCLVAMLSAGRNHTETIAANGALTLSFTEANARLQYVVAATATGTAVEAHSSNRNAPSFIAAKSCYSSAPLPPPWDLPTVRPLSTWIERQSLLPSGS
jgi:hypothetical protein